MSEIEFNPKRWCMEMSKYHVRREEYDIASTFRSVAETLDSLKDANADLLTRHNALVEAVKWHLECDACPLKNTTEAEKHGFAAIWATRRAARAEVDRLLSEEK